MYLTASTGLIRAHLYQKLHYVAWRCRAHKKTVVNVYGDIVCNAVQLKKPKTVKNRPLKAKSPGSSPGNATNSTLDLDKRQLA